MPKNRSGAEKRKRRQHNERLAEIERKREEDARLEREAIERRKRRNARRDTTNVVTGEEDNDK